MLRIGMLPMTCMGSYEKAMDFAKEADETAARLKEEGIDCLLYTSSLGMHYISLRSADGKNIAEYTPDEVREKLMPRLAQYGVKAVSYTHLDVYKRQVRARPARAGRPVRAD